MDTNPRTLQWEEPENLKPGKYYLCEFAVGNETPDGPHPFSRFFVGFLSKRKGPIGEAVVESGDGTGQIVPITQLEAVAEL